MRLQLCRPLSGAVRSRMRGFLPLACIRFNCAAPFRERLAELKRKYGVALPASIVPPPFGSG